MQGNRDTDVKTKTTTNNLDANNKTINNLKKSLIKKTTHIQNLDRSGEMRSKGRNVETHSKAGKCRQKREDAVGETKSWRQRSLDRIRETEAQR